MRILKKLEFISLFNSFPNILLTFFKVLYTYGVLENNKNMFSLDINNCRKYLEYKLRSDKLYIIIKRNKEVFNNYKSVLKENARIFFIRIK